MRSIVYGGLLFVSVLALGVPGSSEASLTPPAPLTPVVTPPDAVFQIVQTTDGSVIIILACIGQPPDWLNADGYLVMDSQNEVVTTECDSGFALNIPAAEWVGGEWRRNVGAKAISNAYAHTGTCVIKDSFGEVVGDYEYKIEVDDHPHCE